MISQTTFTYYSLSIYKILSANIEKFSSDLRSTHGTSRASYWVSDGQQRATVKIFKYGKTVVKLDFNDGLVKTEIAVDTTENDFETVVKSFVYGVSEFGIHRLTQILYPMQHNQERLEFLKNLVQ